MSELEKDKIRRDWLGADSTGPPIPVILREAIDEAMKK